MNEIPSFCYSDNENTKHIEHCFLNKCGNLFLPVFLVYYINVARELKPKLETTTSATSVIKLADGKQITCRND
uniref:Uncharacterized protein n=1 Tax=Trichobilharzia regenti TaxID=157069 RepID=A0AA85KF82_TRIRE|nr:unnamed protein product [Trichobilharzia regenti]